MIHVDTAAETKHDISTRHCQLFDFAEANDRITNLIIVNNGGEIYEDYIDNLFSLQL
jgi:hypothetical protein